MNRNFYRALFACLVISSTAVIADAQTSTCCNIELPPIAQQNGIMATVFLNPEVSYTGLTFWNIPAGYSIVDNVTYLGWCINEPDAIANGGTYVSHIYCDQDSLLQDPAVRAAEGIPGAYGNSAVSADWSRINYILNNKNGKSASEVQTAIWAFIGGPPPPAGYFTSAGFSEPSPANVAALINDANANGGGFMPVSGQVMGIVIALPTYLNGGVQYQPFLIEIPCRDSRSCTGKIGNFVWNDLNGNGCQDDGEPGIPGAQVELFAATPVNCVAVGNHLKTTTTDANGFYQFTDLCAGDYVVRFHTPPGFTHTLLANQACSVGGHPSDETDSDCTCTGATDCDVCVHLPDGATDLTIDCGYVIPPMPLPCPSGLFIGGKSTGGSTPGDIAVAFDQFPAPNDNSYGVNSVGWGANRPHTFKDLHNSDKAGFQIIKPNGTVAVSFDVDYITASALNSPPSGYRSLGPFGGDGGIVKNSTPALVNNGTQIQWDTSFARNLNGPAVWTPTPTWPTPTYFTLGTQTSGGAGANSANLLVNSPPVDCTLASNAAACLTTYGTPKGSQYPLAVPNPWIASYNNAEYDTIPVGSSAFENAIARHVDGWNFHDSYFVTFKQAYLTALGFDFNNYAFASYNAATNTFTCPSGKWCVAPNPTELHNSPAKDCPPPVPTCALVVASRASSSKQVLITVQNNDPVGQFLTNLVLSWPQSTNGNLTQIKLDGDVIWSGSAASSINFAVPPLVADQNKRTIDHNSSDVLTFVFQRNVAPLNNASYNGSATFGCGTVLGLGLPTP